jgi:superfamily I DNA/RNA helicase
MGSIHTIVGPPGCGKTTHIGQIVQKNAPHSRNAETSGQSDVVVLSLTRAAAAEAAGRGLPIPRHAIGTLHSAAYRALGGTIKIAEAEIHQFAEEYPIYQQQLPDHMDVDESTLDDPRTSISDREDYLSAWSLHRNRGRIGELSLAVDEFSQVWERWKNENDLLDFTDLIEIAIRDTDSHPCEPVVLCCDEAQDHSRLELDLIKHWAVAGGVERLYLVGDPWQAIYTWRGAAPEMFDQAKDTEQILDQSYRVPRSVHGLACRWIQDRLSTWRSIKYEPRDYPGDVRYKPHASVIQPERALHDAIENQNGDTIMIMASCSYMLNGIIKWLRQQSLPFANPWRSRRGDWNPLSGRRGITMADRLRSLLAANENHMWTVDEFRRWVDVCKADKLLVRGSKKRIRETADARGQQPVTFDELSQWIKTEQLSELWDTVWPMQSTQNEGKNQLRDKKVMQWWRSVMLESKLKTADYPIQVVTNRGIDALNDDPKIYVGTIHSFKGSEADHVILFPDLSRAGAKRQIESTTGKDEVARLGYVAITRARKTLTVGSPIIGWQSMPILKYLS